MNITLPTAQDSIYQIIEAVTRVSSIKPEPTYIFNGMFMVVLGLISGVALFMWGRQMIGDGLQKAAGDRLRYILEKLTSNPVKGVLVGTAATAIIHSSTAVTVMLVGFVNSNLMTLSQAVGVIFGANIGTTFTTQLVAFDTFILIWPCVFLGVSMKLFGTKKNWRVGGEVLLGFGIIFMAMWVLSAAAKPLETYEPLKAVIAYISDKPLLGVLVGTILTGLIHSSTTITVLCIALAGVGLMPLPGAVAIILGANVGTCVTAMLSAIGSNLGARRVAVAHLVFNVIGVLLVMPFIDIAVVPFIASMSPTDIPRQIANFNTFFNVASTLVAIPFTAYFVKFIKWMVPGEEKQIHFGPRFINNKMLATPSLALEQATQEIVRMLDIAKNMVVMTNNILFKKDRSLIASVQDDESTVDSLQMSITKYLTTLTQKSMSEDQARRAVILLNAVHDVERIGDHATNISELAEGALDENVHFSHEAAVALSKMFDTVDKSCNLVMEAMQDYDVDKANSMRELENEIDFMAKTARDDHFKRLKTEQCKAESGIFYLDIVANLERIGDHCFNISRAVSDKKYTEANFAIE
ncbi:MAG: Na/Pi cotransporter family protein [Caldiserica bacterium]|nr:Na/Pi cotransporter family protein [Caldisericota bacterium]